MPQEISDTASVEDMTALYLDAGLLSERAVTDQTLVLLGHLVSWPTIYLETR